MSDSSVSFTDLLCLLFIGLKLTGDITWSWVIVMSPMWVTFLVIVLIKTAQAAVSR